MSSAIALHGLSEAQNAALLAAAPNFRDVGGFQTSSRRTLRVGRLFRAGDFSSLSSDGEAAFSALGIADVYDLRTDAERTKRPNRLPSDVELVIADVLGDAPHGGAAAFAPILQGSTSMSIDTVNAAIGDGKGRDLMLGTYRNFLGLDSANASYRRFVTGVATGKGAIAFHCTAGKDRTGWAAAILQLFAGVDHATVMAQYLLSNERTGKAFGARVAAFGEAGGDQGALQTMVDVHPEYLDAALTEMAERYGDIEGYLRRGLGLSDDELQALSQRLLE
jgi:protein-tyrosine phosphatase